MANRGGFPTHASLRVTATGGVDHVEGLRRIVVRGALDCHARVEVERSEFQTGNSELHYAGSTVKRLCVGYPAPALLLLVLVVLGRGCISSVVQCQLGSSR